MGLLEREKVGFTEMSNEAFFCLFETSPEFFPHIG